jgi:hypothetical protein
MNRPFFKGYIQLIVSVSPAAIPLPTLRAEPPCPRNVASLPLHLVNRHLFIMAVSVNHSGPTTSDWIAAPNHDDRSLCRRGTSSGYSGPDLLMLVAGVIANNPDANQPL